MVEEGKEPVFKYPEKEPKGKSTSHMVYSMKLWWCWKKRTDSRRKRARCSLLLRDNV